MILGRFVSCLKSTSTGQIIVGLSDGSIHMQSATESGIIKSNNKEDMIDSIDASYWTVVESHKTSDGCVDPIIDIVLSPNETHLIYMFSSVKMGVARITNDDISDDYGKFVCMNIYKDIRDSKKKIYFSEKINTEITIVLIKRCRFC